MRNYNPADWYWIASDGRVFSSARGAVVADPDHDESLADWMAGGTNPTPWPKDDAGAETDAALQDVLTPYGLFVDLAAYAADARFRKETGGLVLNGARIATDRASQAMISGAYSFAKDNATATIKYKTESGFVSLTAAQMLAIGTAVASHVQACFAAEADVVAEIESGTITTTADIDAAFAAL